MSAARPFDIRAYRVANAALFDKTVAELEALPNLAFSLFGRGAAGSLRKPLPTSVIREGDTIAVIGRHEIHAVRGDLIGPEVSDQSLLDLPIEALDVVVTDRQRGRQVAR